MDERFAGAHVTGRKGDAPHEEIALRSASTSMPLRNASSQNVGGRDSIVVCIGRVLNACWLHVYTLRALRKASPQEAVARPSSSVLIGRWQIAAMRSTAEAVASSEIIVTCAHGRRHSESVLNLWDTGSIQYSGG